MKLNEYQVLALRTAGAPGVTAWSGETDHQTINVQTDLLHGAMGVCTEGGEIIDIAKKSMMYGKAIDLVNLKEEVGDVLWYLALLCRCGGFTLEDAAATNIAKLQKRYPKQFTPEEAIQRDLPGERAVLEGVKHAPAAQENVSYSFPGGYDVGKGAGETRWSVTLGGKVVAQSAPDGRTLYPVDSNAGTALSWLMVAQGIVTDHYKPKAAAPAPVKAEPAPEAEPPPAAPAATTEGGAKL